MLEDVKRLSSMDQKEKKLERIVHIAIEFSVELHDCDFLFKDLCWLFQDIMEEGDN